MNTRKEIWKDLKGYEGMYLISNFGNIKGIGKRWHGDYMKRNLIRGNIFIKLNNGKKFHMVKLSILVASHFVDNPNNYSNVSFRDNNALNCDSDNLYWVKYADNIPTLDGEIWKDVVGYEGKYKVSNFGRVFSLTRVRNNGGNVYKGRMLRIATDKLGYRHATLLDGFGGYKRIKVHRLVALAFIPNTLNKPQIDHIDGNPSNNSVKNLRWATAKENVNNPNTLYKKVALMYRSNNPMATPVYGINIKTGERVDFDCMEYAGEFLGVKYPKYIGFCCRGLMDSYKGYKWYFKRKEG